MPRLRSIYHSLLLLAFSPGIMLAQWSQHGGDPQHTGVSPVQTQSLDRIRWSTPVDDNMTSEPILIHYGSPVATVENTIVVPVRSTNGSFRLEARSGSDGSLLWGAPTDFRTAPSDGWWVPSFSPAITPSGSLYYQGAGGTVYRVDDPNASSITPVQISFLPDYAANKVEYDTRVFISTPITSDAAGNIYFGYEVFGVVSTELTSGIARIAPNGTTSFVPASSIVAGSSTGLRLGTNSAPALSLDGSKLYIGMQGSSGDFLAAIDSTTLALVHSVALAGTINDAGTSSPTVGPDGHVYFGTLGGAGSYHFRGTLNHFSGDLSQTFTPGSFGWDETVSIVDADLVPSYTGTSEYLIFSKYNDYYQAAGGTGLNELAILDPFDLEFDPLANANRMKEVLTILGVTPDEDGPPGAVREWCINVAAVDPATFSILVNSEDGWLYRWDLRTNTFTESVQLVSEGVLEAYTPTMIGPDGAVYAINRSRLFSVVPEPGSAGLLVLGAVLAGGRRVRKRG